MSPTNLLKRMPPPRRSPSPGGVAVEGRTIIIEAGGVRLGARLADTATAARIWQALPINAIAETWGALLHFATRIECGRDRTARQNARPGEILYWVEQDRILIPYGATPLSRAGEMRLPSPANVWAHALDDPAAFAGLVPGTRVQVLKAP